MKNKMKQIVFSILLIFLPNNIFATEVFSDVRRISISGDENRIEIKNIKLRQKQKVFFYFENCQIGEGKTKFYKEFAYGYADLHGEPHARLCPVMLNDKQIEAAHFHKDGYNKHRSEIKIKLSDYSLPIFLYYSGGTWDASILLSPSLVVDMVMITKTEPKNSLLVIFEGLRLSPEEQIKVEKEKLAEKIISKMMVTDKKFKELENEKKSINDELKEINAGLNDFKRIGRYGIEPINVEKSWGEYKYLVCTAGCSSLLNYGGESEIFLQNSFAIYSDRVLNFFNAFGHMWNSESMILKKLGTKSTWGNLYCEFSVDNYQIAENEYNMLIANKNKIDKRLNDCMNKIDLIVQEIKGNPEKYKYVLKE